MQMIRFAQINLIWISYMMYFDFAIHESALHVQSLGSGTTSEEWQSQQGTQNWYIRMSKVSHLLDYW